MSRPPQYAQRKDGNQQDIIDALEKIGCDVWVLHQPVDLLVGLAGRTYLLEVKRPKEKVRTPAQIKFHRDWRGHKAIVRTPQEAIDAVLREARPIRYAPSVPLMVEFSALCNPTDFSEPAV